MRELVAGIYAANQELSILLRDRDCMQTLGPPCDRAALVKMQRRFTRLGVAVPPSYEELLRLYDGWKGFFAELDLLSGDDHEAAWVAEVARLSYDCLGKEDPFARMVPVGLIPGAVVRMVFLDPGAIDEAGEAEVAVYVELEEEARHPSFRAYLEWYLASLTDVIGFQKNGDPWP